MSCDVDGCDRAGYAKGLCRRHYQRVRAHGDTAPRTRAYAHVVRAVEFDRPTTVCQFRSDPAITDGPCDREAVARGLCRRHYRMLRRGTIRSTVTWARVDAPGFAIPDSPTLEVLCWCELEVVTVPQPWVREGRTVPCDRCVA